MGEDRMKAHIKSGWRRTVRHFPVISILFLYQLLWGFFIVRAVESVIVPLLLRYPDVLASDGAVQLFLIEAQFQVMKTGLLEPYLWMLGGLFGMRMLLTPLINAGLFHSLHHAADGGGTRFFAGIRAAWKPVSAIYAAELVLLFAPLIWLVPLVNRALAESATWAALGWSVIPYALGWLLWCAVIRLLSLGLQFGAVSGERFPGSVLLAARSFLPAAGVTAAMWGIGALVGFASSAVSMVWAGLFALILHQAHHFIRTWMKVWTYAALLETWQSKRGQA